MRNSEDGIELAPDRFCQRRAQLGLFGERPDASESKPWAHVHAAPLREKLVERTSQLAVIALVSKSFLLQPLPKVRLDVLPGVAAGSTERVLVLPARYIVKRCNRRTYVQASSLVLISRSLTV